MTRDEARAAILVRLLQRTREVETLAHNITASRQPPEVHFSSRFRLVRFLEERNNGPRYEVGVWFPGSTPAEQKCYQRAAHDLHEAGLVVGSAGKRLTNLRLTDAGKAEAERAEGVRG